MATESFNVAKKNKADEFYTQWADIEKEVQTYLEFDPDVFRNKTILLPCDDPEWSNFTKYFALHFQEYGIKKLVSTSYASDSKAYRSNYQTTLSEPNRPKYDGKKTYIKGKIFVLEKEEVNLDGKIDINDLEWNYLDGDGDFRSKECIDLLKQADIVVTNPPFSLFREYVAQLIEYDKKFLIIGNVNAITYKEIFKLVKENKVWLGASIHSGDREFGVPNDYPLNAAGCRMDNDGRKFIRVKGVRWFTNLDYRERHEDLALYKEYNPDEFPKYDNYDAVNVDVTKDIPKDYSGAIGIPITFLDKYNPDQFEILGMSASAGYNAEIVGIPFLGDKDARPLINGKNTYARIFIKNKKI
jgi:hypothetical protein